MSPPQRRRSVYNNPQKLEKVNDIIQEFVKKDERLHKILLATSVYKYSQPSIGPIPEMIGIVCPDILITSFDNQNINYLFDDLQYYSSTNVFLYI